MYGGGSHAKMKATSLDKKCIWHARPVVFSGLLTGVRKKSVWISEGDKTGVGWLGGEGDGGGLGGGACGGLGEGGGGLGEDGGGLGEGGRYADTHADSHMTLYYTRTIQPEVQLARFFKTLSTQFFKHPLSNLISYILNVSINLSILLITLLLHYAVP